MPPETSDASYLWDMLDAAEAVSEFVLDRSFQNYLDNRLLRGGVERYVEIIGEAARKISKTFQDAHPQIPWRGIIVQRHVLAHEYGEIEDELMWRVATVHIPELIVALRPLVPPPPPDIES